jgi:LPS-assembly lipoprotein
LTFRLHDGKGAEYLGPTQVIVQRDLAFDDAQALAFEAESVLLYRDMQSDLVQQLLRRLATAKGLR